VAYSPMRWASGRPSKGLFFLDILEINSSIALLVTRPSQDENQKTTLICTPVALLGQWYNEIRTKTDPPLDVYIHHSSSRGGKKAKTPAELVNHDIVLTTYATIVLPTTSLRCSLTSAW